MSKSAGGRVEGKVALVVGASRGIGEGIARDFAKEGARVVVVCSRTIDEAQKIAEEINQQYGDGRAIALQTDATDEEAVKRMVAKSLEVFGGIDILVYNAGVNRPGGVKTYALKDFDFVTKVNYYGYFLCVKHVAQVMAEQHRRDPMRIMDMIQVNSKSGLEGSNKNFAYAGSKFGGIGLTQSFALELIEDGVKVNAVCPGNYFESSLWSDPDRGMFVQYLRTGKVPGAKTVEDVRRYYESRIPMGRGCTIEEIMCAIYYAIEQKGETGQAILVTGGQLMR